MSARTVAPAIAGLKHPHSRGRIEKIKRWVFADPTLQFMKLHEVTPGGWAKFWIFRAIRYSWLRRDVSPGPLLAAWLWLWTRSPITFGPHPPRLPLFVLVILAAGVGYWSLQHRDKASQDRVEHRADRIYQNACLDCGLYPIPDRLWRDTKPHVTLLGIAPVAGSIERDVWKKITGSMRSVYRAPVKYKQNDDGTGVISIHHSDPLKDEPELPVHLGNEHGPVLRPTWQRMTLGIDANAQVFTFSPHQEHILIGGQTGSGKTSTADALLISFMAAPNCEAVAVAPERASFMFARGLIPCAENPAAALEQMEEEHKLLEKRDAALDELDTSLLFPSARVPLHGLFIDELQNLLDPTIQGDAYVTKFKGYLADILDRGRKRGIVVIAVCTNPRKTVLTEGIRDQFTYRLCFKVADATAASVVVGPTVAGFEPHLLPKTPGRAVLKSDDYYQLRTFRVWDSVARQAAMSACEASQPLSAPAAGTAVGWPDTGIDVASTDESADLPSAGWFHPDQRDPAHSAGRRYRRRDETRGLILDYCRNHQTFSVNEVAEALGIAVRTVSSWFNAKERTNPIPVRSLGGGVYELIR